MYILFFLIWIIFNGQFTWEIAAFGVIISGAMYFFICKFLGYSPKTDLLFIKRAGLVIQYLCILLIEIIKANFTVIKMLTTSRYDLEPVVVRFTTDLKSAQARILLANSITLTPGTITVSMEKNEYVVHCLDKELAAGIDRSVFVQLLEKIEGVN